jgi:23S rRNA pseudouridine2605 synthase
MRLVKFLANAGVASRRAAEPLIATGRVTVNGELVTDPARDVSAADRVLVDGAPARLPDAGGLAVYAVNKPAGVVSTSHSCNQSGGCTRSDGWTSIRPG